MPAHVHMRLRADLDFSKQLLPDTVYAYEFQGSATRNPAIAFLVFCPLVFFAQRSSCLAECQISLYAHQLAH